MIDLAILFFLDEHLPVRQLGSMLLDRGHQVRAVQVGFKDPAILATADEQGAVIITADTWFLKELFRYPENHPRRFHRAGVVQVPGEWNIARARLIEYLPVLEAFYAGRRSQPDPRFGFDISERVVRIT